MPRSQDNLISAELSPEKAQDLIARLRAIQAELPFLISLTKEERKRLAKPSDEAFTASASVVQIAQSFPDHFPPSILDAAELHRDHELAQQLADVHDAARALARGLEDTLLAARSDTYRVALQGYAIIKTIENKLPGVAALIQGLRQTLDRRARRPQAA